MSDYDDQERNPFGNKKPNLDPADEKREVFKEIDREPVFVSSGEGRVGNIDHSFGDFAEQHQELLEDIRGKKVLVKVNAVDPSQPNACTSPDAVKVLIDNLIQYEPAEICIGDQPAVQFLETPDGGEIDSEELFRRFREQMGYDFLDDFPMARFIDFRRELPVLEPDKPDDVRVYDLSQFQAVFALCMPKAHGQLDFSGCRKNMVGLLPQDERTAVLHSGTEFKDSRKNNVPGMKRISETFATKSPKTVYILDGYDTMMGHEHYGVTRVSDFAVVSEDPFNADLIASTLSFSPNFTARVQYLHDIPVSENLEKVRGDVPESADKDFVEHRVVFSEFVGDGSVTIYETAIDPEVDEIVVKPIEERLDNIESLSSINNLESTIKTLGRIGSDRAIRCLFQIAHLTDDATLLNTIFHYVHFPLVSSRGLDPNLSDIVPDYASLGDDDIYQGYIKLSVAAHP